MYKELVRQAMSRLYFYLLPALLFILAVLGHFTMVYLHVEVRFNLKRLLEALEGPLKDSKVTQNSVPSDPLR